MPDDKPQQPGELVQGIDYHIENGLWVFTRKYLVARGHCCDSGCRHCPYRRIDRPTMTDAPAKISRPRQADGRVHGAVVACRREDGRWLCIRRSALVAAPLKVCFPGGAIEQNESQESAVIREMHEELGIDVRPVRCVWHWESPSADLTLWGWLADWTLAQIKPQVTEVAEVLWLTGDEVANHPDAMPTNKSFIVALTRSHEPQGEK